MAKFKWWKKKLQNAIHVFHYGRRMGKTTDLINLASTNKNAVIVVPHRQMARYYIDSGCTLPVKTIDQLLGWNQNDPHHYSSSIFYDYDYYVDEAEYVDLAFLKAAYRQERLKAMAFSGTGDYDKDTFFKVVVQANKKFYKRRPSTLTP